MILLDVKPIETEVCDCMMASLTNAALYFNKDYQFLFSGIWVFGFRTKTEEYDAFWKRLFTPSYLYPHDELRKYHGIQLIEDEFTPYNEFLNVVKAELTSGIPMAVKFSAYYAPWTQFYKKYHMEHYCLIIGIDEANGYFYITDPYVTNKIEKLPIEDLKAGYEKSYTFRFVEPECDIADWRAVINTALTHRYEKQDNMDSFDMMRVFAQEILDYSGFVKELKKQSDLYSFELFYQLKYMSHSRLNYSWFLEFISQKFNVVGILPVVNRLQEVAALWRTVWLKFTKITYMENEIMIEKAIKNISERLLEIADMEQRSADDLRIIINR
ncbi:hypothetical protein HNR77_003862 [Paenibacillus sp. JGP012]|uniref:BtrH N-terminal domain-containing protein n=1 Tax=Paenibacillus sp. JGP012 TaxID=2735914 RepID=UPI00160F66E9|nr:BtrH N-terminal domain-containing protein [Paenibacillus sp. JGP012]MBB6022763.1 hypothetical protein [Paenibacillus sp. JGP012]